MADLHVTATGKDRDGDITKLCGVFGARLKDDAIDDIDGRGITYYTRPPGGKRANVIVGKRSDGYRYLTTSPDADEGNNLDRLPDC